MQAETGGAQRRRVLVVGLAAACVVLALGAPRASAAPTCAPSGADIVCSFATPGTAAWTVPSGVTQVKAVAYGAAGGSTSSGAGGLGGLAQASISVTPGQVLQ